MRSVCLLIFVLQVSLFPQAFCESDSDELLEAYPQVHAAFDSLEEQHEVPIELTQAEDPGFVEMQGPEPVEPPPQEIALEAGFGELVIPLQLESNCARVAGRVLQCISENRGNASICQDVQERHYHCVTQESPSSDNHRNLNRVKQCRHGFFIFNPFDIYFGIAMELYGEWSELEWENMKEFIHYGDTVLDIGAHMGSLTVPIAKRVSDVGKVIAFEPQRVLFQLTTANIALNGLWNTIVHHAGVGNETIKMKFETPHRSILRNFGGIPLSEDGTAWAGGSIEEVDIITVDSLNLSRCDFMKIDVEGMEERVLLGAMQTINRLHPTLYYEDNGYGGIVPPTRIYRSSMVQALAAIGYICYFDVQPYYNPNNYGGEKENFFQFSNGSPQVSTMVLCIHPSRNETLPDSRLHKIIYK